ncbi:MAG: class II aldolase/adducin family protein [Spirochaetales bacterium]|nr:class II aldolase/adducin family protein [Spirochaetales bacterium]
MTTFSSETRRVIVEIGREVHRKVMVVATGGNISARVGSRILITPTGASLGRLSIDELVEMELSGTVYGTGAPSKEWPMHSAVYRALPWAESVVHLHSFYATCAGMVDDAEVGSEVMPSYTSNLRVKVGAVPLVAFRPPGTAELAEAVAEAMVAHEARAVILQNHGILVAGRDPWDAFYAAEIVEENARFHLILGERGRPLYRTGERP